MVTDTSAELLKIMAEPPEELHAIGKPDTEGVSGLGLTYQVADADKESWRPAWRLEVGFDGLVYGKPMKLPKNLNALANYISKRRKDGGPLFTLEMPQHIAPKGEFVCFVAPNDCDKHVPTKGALVDHMEGCHPRECSHYAPFIKQIRDSIAAENPALAAMVQKIVGTPDQRPVEVDEESRVQHNANIPVVPVAQAVETLSVTYDCQETDCGWKPKPDGSKPAFALQLHKQRKHAPETE